MCRSHNQLDMSCGKDRTKILNKHTDMLEKKLIIMNPNLDSADQILVPPSLLAVDAYYTSAHCSGQRYSILLLKFLFFLSPQDLRDGSTDRETFIAQLVRYGCNFKNWVQNLGGDPH